MRPTRWRAANESDELAAHALGDIAQFSGATHRSLQWDSPLLERLPPPGPSDWRACHPDDGNQTMLSHNRNQFKATVHGSHRTLVIVLFDETPPSLPVDGLSLCVSTFIQLPVEIVRPPSSPSAAAASTSTPAAVPKVPAKAKATPKAVAPSSLPPVQSRINPDTGRPQFYSGSVMAWYSAFLKSTTMKEVARRLLVSMVLCSTDLTPDDSHNFVFGISNITEGIGVQSYARLDPTFFRGAPNPQLLYLRTVRVLCHELTHLFGIKHCAFRRCLMNGANHEEEMDAQPLHLCPLCLRKLLAVHPTFDVAKQAVDMLHLCETMHFERDALWWAERARELQVPVV